VCFFILAAESYIHWRVRQVVKSAAPRQLTFSGTEGFFGMDDPNASLNPGAGASCEGEDFRTEVDVFDVATTHMYER
jgi:hypothetical protein